MTSRCLSALARVWLGSLFLSVVALAAATDPFARLPVVPVRLAALHPTQFTAGFLEVSHRAERFAAQAVDPRRFDLYLRTKKALRAVRGPNGVLFLVDGHHEALALLRLGRAFAYAHVLTIPGASDEASFWRELAKRHWAYLFDENGAPRPATALPDSVLGLHDDPFRSLAWIVREVGAYAKTDEPFQEFRWAAFFRSRGVRVTSGWRAATESALHLALSPRAAGLPGYLEKGPSVEECLERYGDLMSSRDLTEQ